MDNPFWVNEVIYLQDLINFLFTRFSILKEPHKIFISK